MLFAIPFPVIDPVLVQVGPLAIRWYALAYITGIVLGWWLGRRELGCRLVTIRRLALHALEQHLLHRGRKAEIRSSGANR